MSTAERERLIAEYGELRRAPSERTGAMLRALGLRARLHPRHAVVMIYPCLESAKAFKALNEREHAESIAVHGPFETEVGPLSVLNLTPFLRRHNSPILDPALPDDATRPPRVDR